MDARLILDVCVHQAAERRRLAEERKAAADVSAVVTKLIKVSLHHSARFQPRAA